MTDAPPPGWFVLRFIGWGLVALVFVAALVCYY